MKKIVAELAVLGIILGIAVSQVPVQQTTGRVSATERQIEATRLGTRPTTKWTAKPKVAGVPLRANHPAAQSVAATRPVIG
ncbi:hypothetical protein [Lactiplantibacillus carotarum]|uniref:hypothetical protein n=1 Tax=Lactiplantibacillus carotarum TaxID=2993456 RepID=UPI00298EFD0E|nr:hypothetical protein [Lactiplantibacillus carotarum]